MAKVVLLRCESYHEIEVKKAVERGINLLGGIDQFVKKNDKILLKPNLLIGDLPEKCTTTHPAIFRAVAEIFQTAMHANHDLTTNNMQARIVPSNEDLRLRYGDSPAFGSPLAAAQKCEIAGIAEKLKIPLADFIHGQEIVFTKGKQNKKFVIAQGVLEADGIISLPKLKTHGFEKLTGCVKNQFGCIPGLLKAEFHIKLPDPVDFARMLVDLNNFVCPRLYIMDGIWAMEGNGPRGGTPKAMNLILMSTDPIALDATVCRIISLNPELVPTIYLGYEAKTGTYKENEILLLGDDISTFKAPSFKVDRSTIIRYHPNKILSFFSRHLVSKPVIETDKCIKCGVCVMICPAKPKALNWQGDDKRLFPQYAYALCIRCCCCQEMCPEKAIFLKKPLFRKALDWLTTQLTRIQTKL